LALGQVNNASLQSIRTELQADRDNALVLSRKTFEAGPSGPNGYENVTNGSQRQAQGASARARGTEATSLLILC
jgi:hypothetical protein